MLFVLFLLSSLVYGEPNPPNWPNNVYVLDPGNAGNSQTIANRIFAENGGHTPPFNGQFSNSRYALLFKPGTHNVNINVGFYTSVIGLGVAPTDTTISSIKVENGDFEYTGGALDNFWRSVENFQTGTTLWAVSQACPMRKLVIKGNLELFQYNSGCCAGYASGGYLSNSVVTGTITSGSQQQWFTRNSNIGRWTGGVWNMVFVGNSGGVPANHCGNAGGNPLTVVGTTPVIAEKPYITIDGTGKFQLRIPNLETNKVGPTTNFGNAVVVDFANVYVATEADSAGTISAKIASGLHVILSPGNYKLTDSIVINRPNITLLGIGFPTLITSTGKPAVVVGNVDGVRFGAVLLQAGTVKTPSLIQIGQTGYKGNPLNPTHLYDIFGRVGGPTNPSQGQVSADVMVQINSGNVVFDNSWLWRADHDVSGNVVNSENPCYNGLVVNGDDVTVYSLAVEHELHDLVLWNGERGRTYFFQSELPYDVTQANFGTPGYVGYRVNQNVQNHHAWGVGVYSFFRDFNVTAVDGFVSPTGGGIAFVAPFTKYLSGNGAIAHVLNGQGNPVNAGSGISYIC